MSEDENISLGDRILGRAPIKRQLHNTEQKLARSEEQIAAVETRLQKTSDESSSRITFLQRELDGVQGTLKKMTRSFELREAAQGAARGARLHKPKWNYQMLFDFRENSWMLTAAINKIIQSVTKGSGADGKGPPWEFIPKFNFKCTACGSDYMQKPDQCELQSCEGTSFREPDRLQLRLVEALLDRPNRYHSWTRILRGVVGDQETIDDWFLEVVPSKNGMQPAELWLLNGAGMEIASDDHGRLGNGEWFCPKCYGEQPTKHFDDKFYADLKRLSKDEDGRPLCPECKGYLKETAYVQRGTGNKIVGRWGEDEIIHGNKYGCPTLFGRPKLVSLIGVVGVLLWMEKYQYSAYSENIDPDSVYAFVGMDTAEVQAMMLEVKEFKQKNPAAAKNLALGVPQKPEIVHSMKSFVDLEAKEMQAFYQQAIAITYGVSLVSLGVQTPGKLGNETEVVEVAYETMEEVQGTIEEAINRFLLPKFHAGYDDEGNPKPQITDWEFRLISPKKDDLQRRANIQQTVAQAAETLMRIKGFVVEITDDWDLRVSGKATGLRSSLAPPSGDESPTGRLQKALTDRNIDEEDAITGIHQAEEEFLKEIRKVYAARIEELAKKGGDLSQSALRKELERIIDRLDDKLARKVQGFIKEAYEKGLAKAKEEFPEAAFNQQDQAALKLLRDSTDGIIPRLKAFTDEQRDIFEGIIRRAYKVPGEFDLGKMVKNMRRAVLDETYKLERIARSETTKISNTARSNQWKKYADPDEEYEWVTAHDGRVCEICYAIANGGTAEIFGKATTFHGNPYTMKELEALVPHFLAHPNDRCTIVRKVGP